MSKNSKNNNPINKKKSKNNSTINKTKNKNEDNKKNKEIVDKEEVAGWKVKSASIILIFEVLLAVLMLIKIMSRSSFTIFNGSKIIWIIYLVIQIILGFTILSRKIDSTKGTFHWESVLITLTYVLLP